MAAPREREYMNRSRPPGWTLGPPTEPGQYWYSSCRGALVHRVTVEWQQAGEDTSGPELVYFSDLGGARKPTARSTGWWRS